MDTKLKEAFEKIQSIEAEGGVVQCRMNAHSDWYDFVWRILNADWEFRAKPVESIPFDLQRALDYQPVITAIGKKVDAIMYCKNDDSGSRLIASIGGYSNYYYDNGKKLLGADTSSDLFMAAAPSAPKRAPRELYVNLMRAVISNKCYWQGYEEKEAAIFSAARSIDFIHEEAILYREVIE